MRGLLAAEDDVHCSLGRSTAKAASAVVVVDGLGTVVDIMGSTRMQPNSTQKLFTVGAALLERGGDHRFRTEIRRDGAVDAHRVLRGNLAIVGGSDPLLSGKDLDALAGAVADSGIADVLGDLVGDVSGVRDSCVPHGWGDGFVPAWLGPLSPLAVDRNRWRRDTAFAADPNLPLLSRFRAALRRVGVAVQGCDRVVSTPFSGSTVAHHDSAPLRHIAQSVLKLSDSFGAEMLLRDLPSDGDASGTAAGAACVSRWRRRLGVPAAETHDGSGLSRLNTDTTSRQVQWLMALDAAEAGAAMRHAVPIAGVDGTLRNRMRGTPAYGRVLAKTGTRAGNGSVNLAGWATTASCRTAWFSFMLTGASSSAAARDAVDAAAAAIVTGF